MAIKKSKNQFQKCPKNHNDKILVLAPHPDDESIGCGGLLIKYASQCDVICLTDGRYGNPEWSEEKTIEVRKNEFQKAMDASGVNFYKMLGIKDCNLSNYFNKFKEIKKNLSTYDYIFMPHPEDNHPDHKAVYKLFKKLKLRNLKAQIVFYEIWSPLSNPTVYIDISDIKDKKKELIKIYQSQIAHIDYSSRILALNSYRGILHNVEYEEAYQI